MGEDGTEGGVGEKDLKQVRTEDAVESFRDVAAEDKQSKSKCMSEDMCGDGRAIWDATKLSVDCHAG